MLNWEVNDSRSVGIEIVFTLNFNCVRVREIRIFLLFMGSKRKRIYMRVMWCIKSKIDIFNIEGFLEIFRKKGIPRIL